ncbi:hypothetical protein KR044_003223, partial [Drosophila immigrans]
VRSAAFAVTLRLCCLTSSATADCCKPSTILFKLADRGNCSTFGGKYHNRDTCEKRICGNGDSIVGTWCGRGRCNPRGCHCHCLPSEPVTSFRQKHGYDNLMLKQRL